MDVFIFVAFFRVVRVIASLPIVFRQLPSPGDVLDLAGLVSADEQQEKLLATLRVVDAVAGAEIDSQFGDSAWQVAMIARVSVNQPIHPNEDTSAPGLIP
jgi:hypothetical protein